MDTGKIPLRTSEIKVSNYHWGSQGKDGKNK
jgi:hypothetical protein